MRAARVFWLLAALLVLLAAALIGGIAYLNTDGGRAFAVRQLPLYAPKSGLTVRARGIEGSLFGQATIRGLELGDPDGVFAKAERVDVDWRPFDLLHNLLTIHTLTSPEIEVLRRPVLRPSADKRILPDIDIAVGRLTLSRIVLDPPVAGTARIASLSGNADIRHGRAKLVLDAGVPGSGDTLALRLDAEPDRDRFDIGAHATAPAGGVIAGLLGLSAPLAVDVAGDGRWTAWRGTAKATLGGAPLADLALTADAGRFGLGGTVTPSKLLTGLLARLAGTSLRVDATATLADREARTSIALRSAAVVATGTGMIDFGDESFAGTTIEARVLQPAALDPKLSARDLLLHGRVTGTFRNPVVDYVATAPAMTLGKNSFFTVRAVGIVQTGARPLIVPVAATAARITGFGVEGDKLLTGVRVTGPLTVRGNDLVGDPLIIRSDRITARARAVIDLRNGAYVATAQGDVPNYLLQNLGVANVHADVRVTPEGGGARVTGQAAVRLTRLDNPFFASLLEGLPAVTSVIALDPAGNLAFTGARLTSPGLSLTASGTRSVAGIIALTGSGVSRRFGPAGVRVAGPLEAPVVDVTLASPGFGVGLRSVSAHVTPAAGNWAFEAKGGTDYGPVAARGLVRAGVTPTPVDLAAITFAGVTGHGTLTQTAAGPLSGRLDIAGAGLSGGISLAAAGTVQRAEIALSAANAKLPLGSPVAIRSGDLHATILLPDSGPVVSGIFNAIDVRRQDTLLTKVTGSIDYRAGRGSAKIAADGLAEAPFTLAGDVRFADDRIEVGGGGTFSGRRVGLAAPAVLTRSGGDWVLAPATVTTPDGRAELSGRFGEHSAVKARLSNLGLSLLTLVSPGFDLGGRVSGTLDVGLVRGGLPVGTAALRISGLSRAGLASASLPIDLALNATLGETGGSARAVIVRGGVVEGRLQAQLKSIPGAAGDPMLDRLLAAPLFAQARYAGPAQALWPLAGIEAVDVRGPVRIAADVGGRLGEPTLSGTITSDGARVENVTLGTVVEKAHLDSRFTASRLDLTSFSGEVGKGGTVTGSGSIGLSAVDGFPLDVKVSLKNAQALKRDDLAATVTGDLHVVSDHGHGRITGKLVADKARFRIGRGAAAEVPVLAVREVNAEVVRHRIVPAERPATWSLDMTVSAERAAVEGLGLQSDWRGTLQIGGSTLAPALTGRVRLIRGDYDFAGKRFQLSRGDLRFTGGYPPDPIVDVVAQNDQGGFSATLTISGTGLKPQIEFGSVPSLPQDEVLSRVLFGTSIANLSAPEALQLAGALASLRGGKGRIAQPDQHRPQDAGHRPAADPAGQHRHRPAHRHRRGPVYRPPGLRRAGVGRAGLYRDQHRGLDHAVAVDP